MAGHGPNVPAAALMSDVDAVLFANEAFYRAFADRDAEALAGAWSKDAPVTCVHPGWGRLVGRDAVVKSWTAILRNPESPSIRCHDPRATIHGDVAWVLCFEEIERNYLIATNVFAREGSLWRMVHHQAGPTAARPETRAAEPRGPLN